MGASASSVGIVVETPDLGLSWPWTEEHDGPGRRRGPFRVLCYGDSLTAGFYDHGKRFNPYGAAMERAIHAFGLDCKVVICGMSGHRADQMVTELDSPFCQDMCGKVGQGLAYYLDHDVPYDLVIIMAGTNDFTPNGNLRSLSSHVCKLHGACHIRGVPTVMLAAPVKLPHLQLGLSRMLQEWANDESRVLAFVDPEEVIPRSMASYWEPDAVHFTPAGSDALGAHLAATVSKIIEQSPQLKGTSVPTMAAPVTSGGQRPKRSSFGRRQWRLDSFDMDESIMELAGLDRSSKGAVTPPSPHSARQSFSLKLPARHNSTPDLLNKTMSTASLTSRQRSGSDISVQGASMPSARLSTRYRSGSDASMKSVGMPSHPQMTGSLRVQLGARGA